MEQPAPERLATVVAREFVVVEPAEELPITPLMAEMLERQAIAWLRSLWRVQGKRYKLVRLDDRSEQIER